MLSLLAKNRNVYKIFSLRNFMKILLDAENLFRRCLLLILAIYGPQPISQVWRVISLRENRTRLQHPRLLLIMEETLKANLWFFLFFQEETAPNYARWIQNLVLLK